MADNPIKAAEKRGYNRGYAAGRKRLTQEDRRNDTWNNTFLALLPACIGAKDWMRGDKPISDIPGRVQLARDFANEAVKYLR